MKKEMRQFSSFIYCSLLGTTTTTTTTLLTKFASGFTLLPSLPSPRPRVVVVVAPGGSKMSSSSPSGRRSSAASAAAATAENQDERRKRRTLSVAILGGGVSGLSCASELLSRHKQQQQQQQQQRQQEHSSYYDLEVTVFDTGRLRPGGRCSSRLPGDASPPAVKNRSSGTYPVAARTNNVENGNRNNRRACDDNDGKAGGDGDGSMRVQVPVNIQRAISSPDHNVAGMGPVDHAAQILSVPVSPSSSSSSFEEFRSQLQQWLEAEVVERFPEGSVCELSSSVDDDDRSNSKLESLRGDNMYYGKGGMGSIPIAMRQFCLSFNGYGENYTGQSFRILQDVWVSPSNGVKYIGSNEDDGAGGATQLWELWNGKKSLGKYDRLVISHNGKCGKGPFGSRSK